MAGGRAGNILLVSIHSKISFGSDTKGREKPYSHLRVLSVICCDKIFALELDMVIIYTQSFESKLTKLNKIGLRQDAGLCIG